MREYHESAKGIPPFVKVITNYVNNYQDTGLLKIKNQVPSNLKSKGLGYHIIAVSPIQINAIIKNKKPIPYPNKKPIISIAKSQSGIAEVKYNMENDNVWKYNN